MMCRAKWKAFACHRCHCACSGSFKNRNDVNDTGLAPQSLMEITGDDHQSWVHLPRFEGGPSLVRVLPRCQAMQWNPRRGLSLVDLHRGTGLGLSRPHHHLSTITTGIPSGPSHILWSRRKAEALQGALFSSLDQPARHHETSGY